jgi:HAE1 family hydrophobic/amphiphilic exporter-1
MELTEFAQKRPIVIWIIAIFIVILGIGCYVSMPMMLLPEIKVPGAIIETTMPGGTARQIDEMVTTPILEKLHTLSNVSELFASSYPGFSLATVEFKIGTNALLDFQDTETRINEAQTELPSSAKAPELSALNLTNIPIMTLAFRSNKYSVLQLTEYAKQNIAKKIDRLKGVKSISINGGTTKALNVNLDPEKMTSYGVNIQDIGEAFQSENVQFPGYFVNTPSKSFLLNLTEKFTSVGQIKNLIINSHKGQVVTLGEVSNIKYGIEPTRGAVLFNNLPAVGLTITKDPSENSIAVIAEVKKYIKDKIEPTLPRAMSLSVAHDNGGAILRNVDGLEMTVFYAIIFASLIVYLFIRSFRSLFIIIIAIPISVLMGILVIKFTGGSFNIITLLSLVLLVGLVVDDAIVVTENIHRVRLQHPELSAQEGTLRGVRQVTFSVLASTITLLAIFSSSVVMSSDIGIIFEAFSVAIIAGVITSYFISMTITPLMAEKFMVVSEHENKFYTFLRNCIDGYVAGYKWCLHYVLKFRWIVLIIMIAYLAPVFSVLHTMGSSFFAQGVDHGMLKIVIRGPPNATLNYSLKIVNEIHNKIKDNKYIANSYAQIGPMQANMGSMTLKLKPFSQTHTDSEKVSNQIIKAISGIPGAILNVVPVPISPTFDQPLMFNVVDSNYQRLMKHMMAFAIDLHGQRKLGSLTTNMQPGQQQYEIVVNRALANSRDITAKIILSSVALFGGHIKVGSFMPDVNNGRKYSIFLEPKKGTLINPNDLNKIYLFAKDGTAIQLSTIAKIKKVVLPSVIHRTGLDFSTTFSGTPLIPVSYALAQVTDIAKKYFSSSTEVQATGQSAASGAAITSTTMGLGFSFLILYFVLTIQFESFLQPIIVLAAEPLALVGAIYALDLCGYTLNIFSLIGILLLMGLVAKNAILLVSRANQYQAKGEGLTEALKKACPERLVPITMTSLTIILAMLPVLSASGVGAKNQVVMSVTIIAGIVASTILSVVFVPAFYSILETIKYYCSKPFHKNKATNDQA